MSRKNGNKSPDIRKSSHRRKSILIINPILLSKTPGNKASLVAINSAIRSSLDLTNPFTTNSRFPEGRSARSHVPVLCSASNSSFIVCCHKGLEEASCLRFLERGKGKKLIKVTKVRRKSSYPMGTTKYMRVIRTSRIHS